MGAKCFQGMRNYSRVPNYPKEEFWTCVCGHKNKSCDGLISHIQKMEKNPWHPGHRFSYLMKHGTRYDVVSEALDRAS